MVMDLAGQTGEQMAQALVAQGWTWDQVRAQYPELFGAGGAGVTALAPTARTEQRWPATVTTPVPYDPIPRNIKGGQDVWLAEQGGQILDVLGGAGPGLPAGVAGALGAIGIGTGTIAALGIGYGLTQAIGVQYPWETGPGEGFIAPWSRDIAQDETGRWVTRETRPDLFVNGGAGAMVPMAGAGMMGVGIAKQWSANGWPFVMTTDGYIHTVTKSGLRKRWKPYKSVVLGKNPSPRMLNRAVTKLVQFDKLHSRIQKMARRIKT